MRNAGTDQLHRTGRQCIQNTVRQRAGIVRLAQKDFARGAVLTQCFCIKRNQGGVIQQGDIQSRYSLLHSGKHWTNCDDGCLRAGLHYLRLSKANRQRLRVAGFAEAIIGRIAVGISTFKQCIKFLRRAGNHDLHAGNQRQYTHICRAVVGATQSRIVIGCTNTDKITAQLLVSKVNLQLFVSTLYQKRCNGMCNRDHTGDCKSCRSTYNSLL